MEWTTDQPNLTGNEKRTLVLTSTVLYTQREKVARGHG